MLSVRSLAPLAAFAAMAFTAAPALADTITFDSSDYGTAYTLNYNGFSNGTTVDGLTAQTVFTLTNITDGVFTFDYTITNTSSSPVTGSRVSSFGFNTNPDIVSASSTGTFDFAALGNNYPNGIGVIDVCFKDVSTGNCTGSGGGLTLGQSGSGTFSLNFGSGVTSATLGEFYVRYQSITGVDGISSASGIGTQSSSSGHEVPEPGMLGLLGSALIATAVLRRRRRRDGNDLAPAYA